MEQQLAEIVSALTAIKIDQATILNRLDNVDSEIVQLKGVNQDNSSGINTGQGQDGDLRQHLQFANDSRSPTSPAGTTASGTNTQLNGAGNIVSVQDEYQSIKDKLSNVKIPAELRVGTSKTGIRREDNTAANIISSSAKYVETTIKLLWNLENNITADNLVELFNIQKAHIEYLRQEHSSLVVTGQFGSKTSQLFKSLARGTSNLDDRQLDILSKAVQITSNENSARPYRPPPPRGSFRGRGGFNPAQGGRGGGRYGWQSYNSSTSGGGAAGSSVNSANRSTEHNSE